MKKSKIYRIKSQFRFTLFIFICIFSIVALTNTILGFNEASGLTRDAYAEIEIEYGDTIWEIASAYNHSDLDIRRVVYEICEINKITADQLHPGMVIQVPMTL